MNFIVPIVLFGWFPLVFLIFRELRGYRAVTFCVVVASLYLPVAKYNFYGIPDYTKVTATAMAILAAAVLFESRTLFRFRPRWFDLPLLAFCMAPLPSAIHNQQGVDHGLSLCLFHVFFWGIPYFIGRVFFTSFESIRSLLFGIFLGTLTYVPLCLFEIRMSPKLHRFVYGFRPGTWNAKRYGGFRPWCFMDDTLELGLWMTAATLLGFCLWRCHIKERIRGIDFRWLLAIVATTTVLCKCVGALILLICGVAIWSTIRSLRSPWPILALAIVPILYIGLRATDSYDGRHVVSIAKTLINVERSTSLQFRLDNEVMLVEKAMRSPLYGWGGNGRNRIYNENGEDITIVDGFWILVLGNFGFLGLVSIYSAFLCAPVLAVFRFYGKRWKIEDSGPVIALSILVLIYSIDCLLNAMPNLIYPLALGAVSTVLGTRRRKLLPNEYANRNNVEIIHRKMWPPRKSIPQPVTT